MLVQVTFPYGAVATGVIPGPQSLIGPLEAWAVILTLLVLCCGLLWLLTKPAGDAAQRAPRAVPFGALRMQPRGREYAKREAAWSPR